MSTPNTAPLSDAELVELVALIESNRAQDPILTDAQLTRLDDLAKRLRYRAWPPLILPPDVPRPTIVIPKASTRTMICDASTIGPGGGA